MKAEALLPLLLLAACVSEPPSASPEVRQPSAVAQARPPERSRWVAAGIGPGFESGMIEREFEAARGSAALERVRAAPTWVVAAFYQGLPRPVTGPDGRITYAGPSVNAVVREKGRWLGWRTGEAAPVPAAVAARLDALIAEPALWQEPEAYPRGACTDAGSLQVAVRNEGRRRFNRQDNCRSRGLMGELGRIVLSEALAPPF